MSGMEGKAPEARLAWAVGVVEDSSSEPDLLFQALDELVEVGRSTWFHCRCVSLNPLCGLATAVCGKWGEPRRVGNRLSRSPWPVYVSCLRRLYPDWFARLGAWMRAYPMLSEDAEVPDSRDGRARLACVDGMVIFEDGEVRGLGWIALPMPSSSSMRGDDAETSQRI